MQQIFDLLAHKLKTIQKYDINSLTNQQKDSLLDRLLIQKKKQNLRMIIECRLQQNISVRNIKTEEELLFRYVFNKSYQLMNLYDKDILQTTNPRIYQAIIQLYVNFFNRQGFNNRAQQIQNMHRKKVCPKSLMPATLLNWLVEWVRKVFNQYLKTNIHSLYINSRQPAHSLTKQVKNTQNNINIDNSGLKDQKFLIIHHKTPINLKERRAHNILEDTLKCQTQKQQPHQQKQKWKINSASPSIRQSRSGSLTSILQGQINHQDVPPINKEVFYYAYSQEIQGIYKNLESVIPDLDINFVRQLRRGGRRNEVQKRIPQIARNIIKHMQYIDQSISDYYNEYTMAHQMKKKSKRPYLQNNHIYSLSDKIQSQIQHRSNSNQINTSQSNRSHFTQRMQTLSKRKQLISSLSKKQRYNNLNEHYNDSTSFLLKTVQDEKINDQSKYKTLDLSIGNSSKKDPQIIVLHGSIISSSLQIIQQKTSKIRLNAHQKQIKYLSRKKQLKKQQLKYKSIDLTYKQLQAQTQRQKQQKLPLSLQLSRSSHIYLPKIKGLK